MSTHAETSYIPQHITTKQEFYNYVVEQLKHLILEEDNKTSWITTTSNTSSLLYHSYQGSRLYREGVGSVNWVGEYFIVVVNVMLCYVI